MMNFGMQKGYFANYVVIAFTKKESSSEQRNGKRSKKENQI